MMKFTMKKTLAAAAIAAMVMSAAAEARIQNGDNGTTGSELVFSAWDGAKGYTYDLQWGSTLSSLIGADGPYSNPVNGIVGATMVPASGILFDSVLTGFSSFANLGAVQWNLAAADSIGRNRLLISQGDGAASMSTSNNNVKNAVTAFNTYVDAVNSKGTHVGADWAADGNATTLSTDGSAYAGNGLVWGNTLGTYTADTSSLLGASTNLWVLGMNSSTTTGTLGSAAGYLAQLKTVDGQNIMAKTYLAEDGYHLQISAVPEPESYAMFLAGLGMMGVIARRRMQG